MVHSKANEKIRILTKEQTPGVFHEPCILTGYRSPNASYSEYFKSMFKLDNNEVISFWTHFIPFLFLVLYILQFEEKHDAFYHPVLIYLSGVALCFFTSSIAHAFHSRSKVATHVLLIMDYMAISALGTGASIAFKAYCLAQMPHKSATFFNYYITFSILLATIMNVAMSSARFILSPVVRTGLKIVAGVLPQVFNSFPIVLRLCQFGGDNKEGDYYFIAALISGIMCPIVYALHFPERFFPRKFDIIGQSHQLYHLCSLLAAYYPFRAIQVDMQKVRKFYDSTQSSSVSTNNFYSSLNYTEFIQTTNIPYLEATVSYFHAIIAYFIANAVIVFYYYIKAIHFNPWDSLVHAIEENYCSSSHNRTSFSKKKN